MLALDFGCLHCGQDCCAGGWGEGLAGWGLLVVFFVHVDDQQYDEDENYYATDYSSDNSTYVNFAAGVVALLNAVAAVIGVLVGTSIRVVVPALVIICEVGREIRTVPVKITA